MLNKRLRPIFVAFALVLSQFSMVGAARADVNSIQIDQAAAEPTSYNHATGGGAWNAGTQNVNIRKSLEGEDFVCNDFISYLTKMTVPNTDDLKALGAMTFDLNYSIGMDTTGKSGVALGEPVSAQINLGDGANVNSETTTATITNTSSTGPMFSKGAELLKTVRLGGVYAGETVVLRIDTQLHCQTGSNPTGNLQFRFMSGYLVFKNGTMPVSPAQALNGGNQTIDLQHADVFVAPAITLAKTVTSYNGTCPGQESITIEPTAQVKFCYVVTNNSNSAGKIGAPLYNITQISDDNGIYPDFKVTLTSGLTDLDGDGVADDLAAGASAYGEYVTAFDGETDSTVVNTATVSGYDKPVDGLEYKASDTATVYVDAPTPMITIDKLTNGVDGGTFAVGSTVNWTYLVKNTGDRTLFSVHVIDNQGVTVTCPKSELAVDESMTCTASGTAIAGNYANTGTAYGTWDSTEVSATDASSYFGANPKIDIQKTPDSQLVKQGDKASFTITVTNTGNVDLTGVVVTDTLASDCSKTIGDLAVSAQQSYTCLSPEITGNLTNVASVVGYLGSTQVTDEDSANVTIDYLPNIEVTKSADPTTVLETGGDVTFTFSVKNKAPEDFTLTSLKDDKFGDLNTQGNCSVPQTIAAGATYTCSITKSVASDTLTAHIDVFTAEGHDPENNPGSGSDDATVNFTDVKPSFTVTKTPNPSEILESGGDVAYTYLVTNNSKEKLFLISMEDNKLGDLNGKGTCVVPQEIAGLGTYSCTVTTKLGDWTLTPVDNTVTVWGEDNEGNKESETAVAQVKFIDIIPKISITKSVNPTVIRSTGGEVDYTFVITNTGLETVTVTSLVDPKIALSADCLALIGKSIPVGGNLQCVTHLTQVFPAGTIFTNTVTAEAKDNENNLATANASASLKNYWFGRTPGYWKNHPEAWLSGYLPSATIQSIFTIPTSLMSGGVKLDLDNNKNIDTLIAGLGYKGGTNLSGGAQILLRASIAALLNKAYYGADYPAETSVSALIAHVNSVLASLNRDKYIALATIYDKWNNGVEGPLP